MLETKKRWIKSGSKSALVLVAVILLTCGVIGGTMAWMYFETTPVNNTFTYGDIDLSLTETDTQIDKDKDKETNTYVFTETEGDKDDDNAITKDPIITVGTGSESCWLFVKIDESANFKDYFIYSLADGWKSLADIPDAKDAAGVYYREAPVSAEVKSFNILAGNAVYAKGGLSQSTLDALDAKDHPTLSFKAYAVQKDSTIKDAAAAWELVK